MDHETHYFELKNKKAKILDGMWKFTQRYMDQNIDDFMECRDEMVILEELENTAKFRSFQLELESIKDNLNELYIDYVKKICSSDLKKEKIMVLKEKFTQISTSEVVNAVNCSRGYARQFMVIEDQVMEKDKRSGLGKKTRDSILKRDGYSCKACGSVQKLEVHHIMPVMGSTIKKLDDPINLVTLCHNCHYLTHGSDSTYNLMTGIIKDKMHHKPLDDYAKNQNK